MKSNQHVFLLFFLTVFIACSDQEGIRPLNPKVQNGTIASRPSVPIGIGEVQIGTQVWTTKNLNVSRYRNGDLIPQVTDPTQWAGLTIGAWCYYSNNTGNVVVYGKLYNAYAVMDARGLSPMGWHIPNDTELTVLRTYLGIGAGSKLKSVTGWQPSGLSAGTNSSGFTALPGGRRAGANGLFVYAGQYGYWWSTTPSSAEANGYCFLGYDLNDLGISNNQLTTGKSVRCIKD